MLSEFKKAAASVHPRSSQLANLSLLILFLTPYKYRIMINLGKGVEKGEY